MANIRSSAGIVRKAARNPRRAYESCFFNDAIIAYRAPVPWGLALCERRRGVVNGGCARTVSRASAAASVRSRRPVGRGPLRGRALGNGARYPLPAFFA
jgi:hypothetical protein